MKIRIKHTGPDEFILKAFFRPAVFYHGYTEEAAHADYIREHIKR